MEEICTSLSAVLCKDGKTGYRIYYEDELLDALPEGVRNRETLEAALKNLQSKGYADVKYARGDAFCIAALNKYVAEENVPGVREACGNNEQPVPALPKKFYVLCAVCAFFGSAAGGFLAAVLGAAL